MKYKLEQITWIDGTTYGGRRVVAEYSDKREALREADRLQSRVSAMREQYVVTYVGKGGVLKTASW